MDSAFEMKELSGTHAGFCTVTETCSAIMCLETKTEWILNMYWKWMGLKRSWLFELLGEKNFKNWEGFLVEFQGQSVFFLLFLGTTAEEYTGNTNDTIPVKAL